MSIDLARQVACRFHAGQKYGDAPYYHHLQDVADSVAAGTTDERLIEVAWLHDSLEDTAMLSGTLYALFEDNVAKAVEAMTKQAHETRAEYLDRCKANSMARIVKIHDSLCNLRASVLRYDEKRIKKYTSQILYLMD